MECKLKAQNTTAKSLEWLKSKWLTITSVGKNIEQGSLICCWWEYKMVQSLWETVWKFPKKLSIHLTYEPAIPFLDIYFSEIKAFVHIKIYMWKFIAAFLVIVPNWKPLKCPSSWKPILVYPFNGIQFSC